MANYDSPIGKTKIYGQQMREFEVSDENESDDTSNIEREIRQAKEDKRNNRDRLSDGAKRRIEMLIGLTRLQREANIDGTVFVFQTLKAKELRDSIISIAEYDGTVQGPFEVRRQFLARSLVRIADVDFETFIGSNKFEAKLAFMDELDESLSNRLYSEYLLLVEMSRDKYAIKTSEDTKEVIDDLKK